MKIFRVLYIGEMKSILYWIPKIYILSSFYTEHDIDWPHTYLCPYATLLQIGIILEMSCIHSSEKDAQKTEIRHWLSTLPALLSPYVSASRGLWVFVHKLFYINRWTVSPLQNTYHGYYPVHSPLALGFQVVQTCQHGSRNWCKRTCYIAKDFVTEPYGIGT